MSFFDRPSTHFVGHRIKGFCYQGGKLKILLDNDDELVVEPLANPYTDSQLSLGVIKYGEGYSEDEISIEDGYGEGDY